MSLLVSKKYHGYRDPEKTITLCADIEDTETYIINLPTPPPEKEIINYGLNYKEQYFKYEETPKKLLEIYKLSGRAGDGHGRRSITAHEVQEKAVRDYPEACKWIEDQWRKRVEGVWMYIHGRPMYIPGEYWFYLNYHPVGGNNLHFRDSDLKRALWWKFCVVEDKQVLGGIHFTRRQVGKTQWAGNLAKYYATMLKNFHAGIQSKTDEDAEDAFRKAIVAQWKRLPFFFAPRFDGTTNPKSKIEFRTKASQSQINASASHFDDDLESMIDFRSSTETAYDGSTLGLYIGDEWGKQVKSDVRKTWDKVKPALMNGPFPRGKALITTTVEEMEEGGGDRFKDLWDRSRIDGKKYGMLKTETGLVQYFEPAYSNYIFDQYGFAIIDEPLEYQREHLQSLGLEGTMGAKEILDKTVQSIDVAEDRQDFIRKHPRTIKEAFRSMANSCPFAVNIMHKRIEELMYAEKPRRGHIIPLNRNELSEMTFVSDPDGPWEITHMPAERLRNHIVKTKTGPGPGNTSSFVAGCDPFMMRNTTGSQGVAHIWGFYDPLYDGDSEEHEWVTDNFVAQYAGRPDTPQEFSMHMLFACIYFGCKIYPETNVPVVMDTFLDLGFGNYLLYGVKWERKRGRTIQKTSAKPGEFMSRGATQERAFAEFADYIVTRGNRCPFIEILEDGLQVGSKDLQKLDYFASSTKALVGRTMHLAKPEKKVSRMNKSISLPGRIVLKNR